jgi:hypothetical protein
MRLCTYQQDNGEGGTENGGVADSNLLDRRVHERPPEIGTTSHSIGTRHSLCGQKMGAFFTHDNVVCYAP